MEAWLDRLDGVDHLRNPAIAQMVCDAIAFREGRDWRMFEYVVMPNHIHLFFELLPGNWEGEDGRLKYVLEQFRRWTGHQAGKLVDVREDGFWQPEWFDHWSRCDDEDTRTCEYIRRNPEKAHLVRAYLDWPYGSWHPVRVASRAIRSPSSARGASGRKS